MFKNTFIASSAIAALMGITAPSFAEQPSQENYNNFQHNRDVGQDYLNFHQDYRNFDQDARDVRYDDHNNGYANFWGRYDAEGRKCVYFDGNNVRQIRESCLISRNGDFLYYRDSNGGPYWRNGDGLSCSASNGDLYRGKGYTVYNRDSNGGTYISDASGTTYYRPYY